MAKQDRQGIYTDPALRERIKEKIRAGDRGGRPGQWSARKSQLLTHEYEKQGGGYTSEERTDSQKGLEHWTEEEWSTANGEPAERDGEMHRYLPKAAWERLSPAERRATDARKVEGSKGGEQYVWNTEKAKAARRKATKHDD